MKRCLRCKTNKNLNAFYGHQGMKDGHLNICKECTKTRVKKHRNLNLDKIQAYDRFRRRMENLTSEQLDKKRNRLVKNRSDSQRRYRKKHPEKAKALNKSQRIKRPSECSCCGKKGKVEGHHEDYSRPMELTFLCNQCHNFIHRKD